MGIVGTFIGVNAHQDPEIRDLVGARRDATALWSVFCDAFEELDANLFVDADAIFESVSPRVPEQFENATEEDTLVLTFSGHGLRGVAEWSEVVK